jgi:indolepyruvate ferredoxin oxidoreductase
MAEILDGLTPANHATAVEIARLPQQIRGFGPVKMANLDKVRDQEAALLAEFRNPTPLPQAAE